MKFILKYVCLVAVFFCAKISFAVEPMNVLFIGNSYTHYNNMPGIFQDIAVSKGVKINVEMSAKSNHTLKMHCARTEMFEKINSKKWDYIVVQGFSRELLHEQSYLDTSFVPYFKQISDSIYKNNACTNILLFMTWGYKTGIHDNPEYDTYQKMSDKIQIGYQYISNVFGLPIVPVGQVWETVKENNPHFDLYQEDNQHPTIYGSYIAACTFYAAIIKASPFGGFDAGIEPKIAEIIQNTAFTFLNLNIYRYDLSLNTLDVKYETNIKGKNIAYCRSNYPKAKSIHWDFGDNTYSDLPDIDHFYRKSGAYNVSVTIVDECGKRVILRKVYFKVKEKPKEKTKANTNNKKPATSPKKSKSTADSTAIKKKKF
ncbi:MAG: hypothetical protein HYR91_13680 [Flavobacteriia bacterium]|nr:hypothetical protein [Flavobacteriia bacterium]